jgi:hypothetical protein
MYNSLNNDITVFLADSKVWNYRKILKMNYIEYIMASINKMRAL